MKAVMFGRRNASLVLCMLSVLSAMCSLGLPTTVDCPWSIIGPGFGNIPGQIPVGKEVLLQVDNIAIDLACKTVVGIDFNSEVVRWVSSDPAVAMVRNATNADGLGAGVVNSAFLRGVSPGSTTVLAFVTPSKGAREVESRPLPVTVIP